MATTTSITMDAFLRGYGYTIYARPKHGPTIWLRPDRTRVNEDDAVKECLHKRNAALAKLKAKGKQTK